MNFSDRNVLKKVVALQPFSWFIGVLTAQFIFELMISLKSSYITSTKSLSERLI